MAALLVYVWVFWKLWVVLERNGWGLTEETTKEILKEKSHVCKQLILLVVIYLEFPMMLCLVIASLLKPDIYHIVLLFFFVFYMVSPQKCNKYMIVLVIYANFFIIEKYTYTMVTTADTSTQTLSPLMMWLTALGFTSEYNPNSTREYFRYSPKFDQWSVLTVAFMIYRRVNLLGKEEGFVETKRKTLEILARKLPLAKKTVSFMNKLYYHSIMILAIVVYLVMLAWMAHSLMNDIS